MTKTKRLKELLDRLYRAEHVQNKDLQTVLSAEEYVHMKNAWEGQKELRIQLKNKPATIKNYERMLKRALFIYNKADTAKNSETIKRLFDQADKEFEKLLEYLQEIIAADADLKLWFDRDTDYTISSSIALSPITVPRVVTSKSMDKVGAGLAGGLMTKREIKIQALEMALQQASNTGDDKQQKNKFKLKLAALKTSQF